MYKVVLKAFSNAILSSHSRFASNKSRQSNILKKLMTGKKRATYYENVDSPAKPKLFIQGNSTPTKIVSRRVIVLNKLLMGHVSDLIANGSVGNEIQGVGLVITKVWAILIISRFEQHQYKNVRQCIHNKKCL